MLFDIFYFTPPAIQQWQNKTQEISEASKSMIAHFSPRYTIIKDLALRQKILIVSQISFLVFYNILFFSLIIAGGIYGRIISIIFGIIGFLFEFSFATYILIPYYMDKENPFARLKKSWNTSNVEFLNGITEEDNSRISTPFNIWAFTEKSTNTGIFWVKIFSFLTGNISIMLMVFVFISDMDDWDIYPGPTLLCLLGLILESSLLFIQYRKKKFYQYLIIGLNYIILFAPFLIFFGIFVLGVSSREEIFIIIGFIGIIFNLLVFFAKFNYFTSTRQRISNYSTVLEQTENPEKQEKKSRSPQENKHGSTYPKDMVENGEKEINIVHGLVFPLNKEKLNRREKRRRVFRRIGFGFFLLLGIIFFVFGVLFVEVAIFFAFKRNRVKFKAFRAKFLIKRSLKVATKANKYEDYTNFRGARRKWRKARRLYNRAIKASPSFSQIAYITNIILLIKKKIGYNYLSEGIHLSSVAWRLFQQKKNRKAIKKYKKVSQIIEKAILYIEKQERKTADFEFSIKISLIYEILKLIQMMSQQIDLENKYKKQADMAQNTLDLQEIFEKIDRVLKEINETLWIYNQFIIIQEKEIENKEIMKLFDKKLTYSIHSLSNLQDRMSYLLQFLESVDLEPKDGESPSPLKNFDFNSAIRSNNTKLDNITQKDKILSEKQDQVKIIREYEYIGGKIRFKVGLVNSSSQVITNLAIRFDLPDALKWIIHEPTYVRRGDTILIPKLGGNEKIAISLYLEPINCLQSSINATLTYFDTNDHPQAVIMPPKKVSITCPIFFTREDANIARVKSIQQKLKYSDKKVFPMGNHNDKEIVFNHILDVIGRHDVKLVDKEYSHKEKTGEAWFYGLTKVKKQKMVIKLIIDSNHHSLEVNVNGDNQEPITGLLAELEGQIREKLLISKIITDGSTFNDISTSILLGSCPYCNGPIDPDWISLYKKGEIITCKYCDTPVIPY